MRTFVVCNDGALNARLRELLVGQGQDCPPAQVVPVGVAAARLTQAHAELIVVVLSPDPEPALARMQELHDMTSAAIFAVGPIADSKLILRAMRAGAHEYLNEAEMEAELSQALRRLQADRSADRPRGRIVAVMAPSGGSGASTLAVSVATLLAQHHRRCALLDLKLRTDDLATLLDLKPTHTLADLCRNLHRLDRCMFEQLFVQHPSGVHLLASPRTFGEISDVTVEGVHQALLMARQLFPHVLVELDGSFGKEQVEAIHQANVILIVFRLDFPSLRNTRRALDYLDEMGVESERVWLVVNRYRQPKELRPAKVQDVLGRRVFLYIPDDPKTVNRANNKGVPVVLERPSARVSRCFAQLASSVNGQYDPEEEELLP
ncbi:MAG: hypothetical protein HY000_28490 [Planctomycetes bacterium]|nr:hypothetical protein [Planctomycetota bacterium]